LPGDISIQKEHSRFYFPIVTCLLISACADAVDVALSEMIEDLDAYCQEREYRRRRLVRAVRGYF
jgi:hypothetical protein